MIILAVMPCATDNETELPVWNSMRTQNRSVTEKYSLGLLKKLSGYAQETGEKLQFDALRGQVSTVDIELTNVKC